MPITKSPLRYPGGKTQMSKFVEHTIEINKLNNVIYCEPFSGGAGVATKGKLKSKQLTKWILKKQKEKMPWGKLVCAVAAKLLRIVRAVLISNKPYNSKIAGVAKCSLPKGS